MRHLPTAAIVMALAVGIAGCGEVENYESTGGTDTTLASDGTASDDRATDDEAGDTTNADADQDTGSDDSSVSNESAESVDDEPMDDESSGDDAGETNAEGESTTDTADEDGVESTGPAALEAAIINTYPHDSSAFTQGLTIIDGTLIESTGLYGESSRRRVGLTNGEVSTIVPLDESLFGAGLTVIDDATVLQLTWREGVAILSDVVTLQEFDRFNYSGEGWGLCHDGDRLVMSNGSSTLTVRDPMSFAQADTIEVTRDGTPVSQLNELECVDGDIWANVWLTNEIIRIDGTTGEVTGFADLTALVPEGPLGEEDVLNGIAYDPATNSFFVTGKNWDVLYEVSFTDS